MPQLPPPPPASDDGGESSSPIEQQQPRPPQHAPTDQQQQQQQQPPQPQPQQLTEAGALRALVRASATAYRTIVFGSFPRRVPVRTIGPLTDRLATAYDAMSALRDAHQEQQSQQGQGVGAHRGGAGGGATKALLLHKMQLCGTAALQAAPNLVRSAALGTVVFELYEESQGRLAEQAASALPSSIHPLLLPATCITAGGAAGACHGLLYTGWEHGRVRLSRLWASVTSPPRPTAAGAAAAAATTTIRVEQMLGGTTAAHALAHGTLFGSFEVVKEALFVLTGAKHEEPLGVVLVGIAGAVAGVCEEAASHFTQAWELEGLSSLPQALKRHGAPPLRSFARTATLPSAIGFLAFEYGRLHLDEDDDEKEGDGD